MYTYEDVKVCGKWLVGGYIYIYISNDISDNQHGYNIYILGENDNFILIVKYIWMQIFVFVFSSDIKIFIFIFIYLHFYLSIYSYCIFQYIIIYMCVYLYSDLSFYRK